MRPPIRIAALAAFALASVPLARGADAGTRPRVVLSASPARIAVAGGAARVVVVRNAGAGTVVVDATRAPFGPRSTPGWLDVVPGTLTLPAHRSGRLTVRIAPARRPEPGEHDALVLLTTRAAPAARVGVRIRLGLLVSVHVPGIVSRRVEVRRLRIVRTRGRRVAVVAIANRGNVTEELSRGSATVSIVRGGRVLARLPTHPRDLRPGALCLVRTAIPAGIRGRATAVVEVRRGPGLASVVVRFAVRL